MDFYYLLAVFERVVYSAAVDTDIKLSFTFNYLIDIILLVFNSLEQNMNNSLIFSLRFIWFVLALANFIIQLAYYFHDMNRSLFIAKKTTTPLLLFFGLIIVVLQTKSFPLIPSSILLAMGIGELGIEGSSAVEARDGTSDSDSETSIIVVISGVLFLLVNIFIGISLIVQGTSTGPLIISSLVSSLIFAVILTISIKYFKPLPSIRTQMMLYSAGIVILLTGAIVDIFRGISTLGWAAVILTISDTLVLIRMGAGFNKKTRSGFRILLVFLVIILILYYYYMTLLINMGNSWVY